MQVETIKIGPVTVYLGAKSGKYPDGNQVVVCGKDTTIAFDTPLVSLKLAEVLRKADLVVLGHAHEDHLVGLHLVPDVPVQAPLADLRAVQSEAGLAAHYGYRAQTLATVLPQMVKDFHYVPRPDATGYPDGTVWQLGGGVSVRAIHMPGHTSGHTVLLVEPAGIAFMGDIDLTGFGPYYGDATSNLAQFRRSMIAVEHLPAKVWITSHHKAVISDRSQFLTLLQAFRNKVDDRDEAIVASLGAQAKTLDEIAQRRFVYPQDYPAAFVPDVERHCLVQHLEALVSSGRLQLNDGRYRQASDAV
jgi:glyoxylase-like metal-dependent hydrolase (beta-lactamase superfamily II)